jgi:hypothetical protein
MKRKFHVRCGTREKLERFPQKFTYCYYIILRQNSAVNAEKWANVIGTRKKLDVTFQITNKESRFTEDTGYGSARGVREFLYHPDDIKNFKTGNGIYVSKDEGKHSKIIVNKPF